MVFQNHLTHKILIINLKWTSLGFIWAAGSWGGSPLLWALNPALCPVALPLCSLKMYTLLCSLGISEHPMARGMFSNVRREIGSYPHEGAGVQRERLCPCGHSLTEELMRTTVNFLSVEPDTNLSPDSLYQVRFIDRDGDSDLIFSNFPLLLLGIQWTVFLVTFAIFYIRSQRLSFTYFFSLQFHPSFSGSCSSSKCIKLHQIKSNCVH